MHDIKHGFTAACLAAEIVGLTFHDLRHTFGTRLADAGCDAVKIRELMGHSSITRTMRYMHASDEVKRAAVQMLADYTENRGHKSGTNDKQPTPRLAVSS